MGSTFADTDLRGNTLRVYTYLFKVQKSVPKQVQLGAGIRSASLAQYHLDKLVAMGLVRKDDQTGEYILAKEIKVEALEEFFKIGTRMIPRLLLYSVVLTVLFGYILLFVSHFTTDNSDIWTLILGGLAVPVLWYETIRARRRIS